MSEIPKPTHYLIIDVEATCSDDNSLPREQMEIIEIGAVKVEAVATATGEVAELAKAGVTATAEVAESAEVAALEPVTEFQTFVRPVRHHQLTPFCRRLTTITQEQVDTAPLFPEALEALVSATGAGEPDVLFCSWGDYDRKQFLQDCAYHGLPYPFGEAHLNLKFGFRDRLGVKKKFGIDKALRRLGLAFEGTPHRGIDDVRNIVRMLGFILGDGSKRREG